MEIFLVNLKDKKDRLDAFRNSSINFRLIEAVDTRSPDFDIKPYGLKLKPVDKINDLYFSKGMGALGCYLSHYVFWKYVVSEKLEYALVLEDDAWIPDVVNMLNEKDAIKKHFLNSFNWPIPGPKLVQLNKRESTNKLPFWMEGTESYAINYKAAELLIEYTHNFSNFKNIFIEYAWSWPNLGMSHLELFEKWKNVYKHEKYYETTDTIRYAVDKFLGYCSHPSLPSKKRLNIQFDPYIGLLENNCKKYLNGEDFHTSDVMGSGKRIWEMSFDEIISAEDTLSTYKWWDNGKEPKKRCENWCLDHPAKVQEKCTWSTLACVDCDECSDIHQTDDSLWKIKRFDIEPSEESINLIVVLCNEELLINYFIEHYIKLGVTHFTFIDNGSTDTTLEKILEYDNINSQVFYTNDSYAKNDYGMAWVNGILRSQLKNLWCVVVDVDELFMFRNENETLHTLRNKMQDEGKNATNCCLIDFYPKNLNAKPKSDKSIYQPKIDFLLHSNYYDKFNQSDLVIYKGHDGVTAVKGGMRHRVFGTNEGSERVSLTKKSFFKNEMYDTHTLSVGMHWWIPSDFTDWQNYDKWDESNKNLKFYDEIFAIGHFKFLKPNIYEYFNYRVKRGQDWNDSEEYKKYLKSSKISFYETNVTRKYTSVDNLYKHFIDWFEKV